MIFGLDYNQFREIYLKIIEILLIYLAGMISYRFSILNTFREQKIIKKQAYTDPLTSGGNRQLFLKVIDNLVSIKKKFALCYLDLDGFKQVNDTLGHDAGDQLLIKLYSILRQKLMNKNGTAYRLGGDEFAIILTKFDTTADIANILDELKEEFKKPIVIENTNILLEYSLGIAIYPIDADNRKDLLSYADDSMYYIKEHGKNSYYFHNKILKAKQDNKNRMDTDLKKAYIENQFGVSLQPRINIADTSVIAFEALVYWNHPVLGYLKAEYFINQAEELGLIINLDEFVLEECCKKIQALKNKGLTSISIAVNMSNRHARRSDFIDNLCNILNKYSIKENEIQIELTDIIKESEIESIKGMLERLKEQGAGISVTNVAVEYELSELLLQLPIDEIKINGQYLEKESKFSSNVLNDIIKLSKDLGYKVAVTHVDYKDELYKIIARGIDRMQGNYISKRIDLNEIETFINNYDAYKIQYDNIIKEVRLIEKQSF